jgi:hypothetical protein
MTFRDMYDKTGMETCEIWLYLCTSFWGHTVERKLRAFVTSNQMRVSGQLYYQAKSPSSFKGCTSLATEQVTAWWRGGKSNLQPESKFCRAARRMSLHWARYCSSVQVKYIESNLNKTEWRKIIYFNIKQNLEVSTPPLLLLTVGWVHIFNIARCQLLPAKSFVLRDWYFYVFQRL